ncbi:unnamed protein product [Phytophthora lilii]|uniref:Unnamed protein product n=1 Tax=Phytophthora lilii TaxID=2077276 RepID=A0A9W6TUP7_9STRA|nr:unnamed protein product [Phytophthora lilii]
MPSQSPPKRHTPEERRRVLDAYASGDDWRAVARHNGLLGLQRMLIFHTPHAAGIGTGRLQLAAIADHCIAPLLYTVNLVRVEPTTCNSEANKEKRKTFAEALIKHNDQGDLVVYFDETNYNLYTKRTRSRAKKGKRAVDKLPPSKGANLPIQCAFSSAFGVVAYGTHRGSIKMQSNADFVEALYKEIKQSDVYHDEFLEHDDLVLLRLGPHSPMCNPIENCFSALKAHIKEYMALMRDEMNDPVLINNGEPISKTEARMQLLERAAHVCMPRITQRMVQKMELHASKFVNAAVRMEDMVYGA